MSLAVGFFERRNFIAEQKKQPAQLNVAGNDVKKCGFRERPVSYGVKQKTGFK